MIPKSLLKKVKGLEISTRKVVNSHLAGEYKTAFKGQGMTFADFREYVAGDDVRSISWALTARTGKTYVKKFEEERELNLMLVVDISKSLDVTNRKKTKAALATEMAALLSMSAVHNKDPVGLLLVSDRVEHIVPPQKGKGHSQRILRDLLYVQPSSAQTELSKAFVALMSSLKKRSVVVVLSDFLDTSYESSLKHLAKRHDVIAVLIEDGGESAETFLQQPIQGLLPLQDLETGDLAWMDLSSKSSMARWAARDRDSVKRRVTVLKKAGVDVLRISPYDDPALRLMGFFAGRRKR